MSLIGSSDGEIAGKLDPKPVSPAQLLYAKKLAQGKGIIIPDDARSNSTSMSAWIDANRGKKRRKSAYTVEPIEVSHREVVGFRAP
jgi:hypothetical protein